MISFGQAGTRGPYKRSESARERILAAIRLHPGISRSEIRRLTGLSWGAVAHHVRGMTQRNEIAVHVIGRRPYYHDGVPSLGLLPMTRLLRTEPVASDILRILNRSGALTIQDLSKQLDVDRKTVKRHVDKMHEAGVLDQPATRLERFRIRAIPLSFKPILTDDPAGDEDGFADRADQRPSFAKDA